MNHLKKTIRIWIAVMMIGTISARENSLLKVIGINSLLQEKKLSELFGEEYISARNQVVIGKAVIGGMTTTLPAAHTLNNNWSYFQQNNNSKIYSFIGYVGINGTLRVGADQCSLNEEYINQKCDENLSENIAWIVKPFANAAVDLAYDFVTVQLLKGIQKGIDQNRNS
ncbi:MAG TPA: hypothetical protein VHX42_04110 [Candidatus Babeliales bacterium]|jgi:hypothetical protein|nr:hypothetical protein [Candidatus Babeliales bacterium]